MEYLTKLIHNILFAIIRPISKDYSPFLILMFLFSASTLSGQVLKDSIPYFDSQFQQFTKENKYEEAIGAARKIIAGYSIQFPDSAYNWAIKAHELALKIDNPQLIIERLATIGRFTFAKQHYQEAVKIYESIDSLIQLYPHEQAYTRLLFDLAEGYEYTDRPQLSRLTYQRCYENALKQDDIYMLSKLDIKMGNLYGIDGNHKKALASFKKAFNRTNKTDYAIKRLYYTARINYVSIVLEVPEKFTFEEKAYFTRVVDTIYQNFLADEDMHRFLPTIEEKKIKITLLSQDESAIQKIALPSIESIKQHTSNLEYIQSQLGLYFQVAMAQKNIPKAKIYLDENEKLIEQKNHLVQKINYLQQKKEWLVATKNYKSAFAVAEELHDAQNQLNNKERLENIDNLEGQIAAKQSEANLLIANKEKELLATRNQYLRLGGAIFSVLFAIIVWLFYKSRKKNKIISQQNTELASLNLTKDRIFAVLGHDLRKPAISFRGITEKLRYLIDQKDFKTMEKLGSALEKNALTLNQLTDNLLNWALTQKDAISYQPSVINVMEATEETIDLFQPIANEKNIQLITDIPEDLTLYADLNSFLVIVRNLVDNAIKFTPTNGTVQLISTIEKEGVIIKIKDTGIGIPANKINEIFKLQKDKSNPGTKGEKGTGLGLHLVNELVKINKGIINVFSQKEKGTTFNVLFPKKA